MLIKQPNGLVTSTILSPYVTHAYTTRAFGDMKQSEKNRQKIINEFFDNKTSLETGKQEHGNMVGVDALVTKDPHVALGVFVADCVPILLVDIKKKIIGVVHAGWKGTLGDITTKTIVEMKKLGSNVSDILVSMGPHIGMCHYDVTEERAQKFLNTFDNDPKVASFFEGSWHLDIGWANYRQLLDTGIKPDHIDAPPTCTVCQVDTYFSFRKDSKKTYGEIMGIIGNI